MWQLIKNLVLIGFVIFTTIMIIRVYQLRNLPDLELWHTVKLPELSVKQLDASNWQQYIEAENIAFSVLSEQVIKKIPTSENQLANRYFINSPLNADHFSTNWNHSYILLPEGTPQGAVVLLHGLTDSPYSMRNIAMMYQKNGFVAIGLRLPGHGTAPSGLTYANWEQWLAATRLALREARRQIGNNKPVHLVGYSNGGALAVKYSLDAIENPQLETVNQLVLISPMIGVSGAARFSGIAALPALLPAFAHAAWLDIVPEFNPYKYNSFPVNGGRQSFLLTQNLQEQFNKLKQSGLNNKFPPVLTFQSVVDSTVSTPAIMQHLYANVPQNNSEVVFFDINRAAKFGPLLRSSAENALPLLVPTTPQTFQTTLIVNNQNTLEMIEKSILPGDIKQVNKSLKVTYPRNIYSLSHVALPFSMNDPLYGMEENPEESTGVQLGSFAPRGERGVLLVSLDTLTRINANPFYSYLMYKIEKAIPNSKVNSDSIYIENKN